MSPSGADSVILAHSPSEQERTTADMNFNGLVPPLSAQAGFDLAISMGEEQNGRFVQGSATRMSSLPPKLPYHQVMTLAHEKIFVSNRS
jgi:hypothetical protein